MKKRITSNNLKTKTKLLIIDDDRKLCQLLREYLEPMGYQLTCAYTGSEGLEKALNENFHAVITDVMLPDMDGFEVLKKLRRESDLPVLMLTSRGDETDRIVGLEIGADDYLPKTFSTRELLARLRAVIRRSFKTERKETLAIKEAFVIGDLQIEQASRTALLNNIPVELTPIEFDLLACLAHNAGRVLSRDQLLNAVADRTYEAYDRSIDMHISSLRHKLCDNPKKPRFIKTVRTAGYMFIND